MVRSVAFPRVETLHICYYTFVVIELVKFVKFRHSPLNLSMHLFRNSISSGAISIIQKHALFLSV